MSESEQQPAPEQQPEAPAEVPAVAEPEPEAQVQPEAQAATKAEAKSEPLLRRLFASMGAVMDRGLGRSAPAYGGLTTDKLIRRMKTLIDERARDHARWGRIAPHHLKLKIEWGTHSDAPPEAITDLEHEILAAAIDHINDNRYRTLAPLKIETAADIFTTGISIDPTYGEFEASLQEEQKPRAQRAAHPSPNLDLTLHAVEVSARIIMPNGKRDAVMAFQPGGRHLNIGRVSDNDLSLNHPSVSKIHATMVMNRQGTLLVADTGSTNGTYINGRRIAYGEARQIEEGDVVGFGDVEVRFQRIS